jgi:nucleoside-diphosphate-sugar epimerase
MTAFWAGRRVLVTGAGGFIGAHVAALLATRGARVTAATGPRPAPERLAFLDGRGCERIVPLDLTAAGECASACRGQEAVFNLAHADGSVAFKRSRPAWLFRWNTLITLNVLEAAQAAGVERVLIMSSSEVYPAEAEAPLAEPAGAAARLCDRTDDGYAWSKRVSELAAGLYAREHGIKVAVARPNNVYGPGDHFAGERCRVVPSLIRDAFEATDCVRVWGSGEQVRTFLYVEDLARGLLDLAEHHAAGDPVNFGGEEEVTIRQLAETIVRICGRALPVVCDAGRPAGAARRTVDLSKARAILGFRAAVPLERGLRLTVAGYESTRRPPRGAVPVGASTGW